MGKPPPYVAEIGKNFIRLKVPREKYWRAARNLGAGYRWFPPAFGIRFETQDELHGLLSNLRDAAFTFLRTSHVDSPAAMMEECVTKAFVSPGFVVLDIADKDHWTVEKNEKRPLTRPLPTVKR